MYWDNRINNRVERPTAPIYALRKEGRIDEAYQIALQLYNQDSDDDIKKALSWVLIDLCKKYVSEQNLNQAQIYFNQLSNIQFDFENNFVETIQKQIRFLKPKIDVNYGQIQQAEELSKNGHPKQALDLIRTIITNNQLTELHHEIYGWIIYRYIKAEENNLTSVQVRAFLRDYMNLKNERPSMLHSMILNFALNYSKSHSDFNFYKFFILWSPENLRNEDLRDGYKDGHDIPSLISRICRELSNSNAVADLEKDPIIAKINLNKETVLDFFREPYFWNLFNANKENKFNNLWQIFDKYNETYSKYGKSKWHSEILKLADRFMKENESWRFFSFFKKWNPNNLMDADWKEEKDKEGETYKPLAIKAIKKSFEIVKSKNDNKQDDYSWLILLYNKAIKLFSDDEWLMREKALLHLWQNDLNSAIAIYQKLVFELGDKFYVWSEFAECVNNDTNLKIGMLSKALCLERNEDFLGDIHLKLAKLLIDENLLENASLELDTYKKHREEKKWKISQEYDSLYHKVSAVNLTIKDNNIIYDKYIPLAEEFAYKDIAWTEIVLVDKWKDDKGKNRLTFTNGNSIEFAIGINRFPKLKKAQLGQVWNFKLLKQEIKKEVEAKSVWMRKATVIEYKYLPLLVQKSEKEHWAILEDCFAVIDYINIEKEIIHAITTDNKEVFFPHNNLKLEIGSFIKAKFYIKSIKNEKRIELCGIQIIEKEDIISKFFNKIALVDGINESRQLFHFMIDSKTQGIVKYNETVLRPHEGDFLKIIYATKMDKQTNKFRVKILDIQETDEVNNNLSKNISGFLEVKYKNGNDFEDYEDRDDNFQHKQKPDFAFIDNYYVPKYLLEKHNITDDCQVKAKAIFAGDKWKVIDIIIVEFK